MLLLATISTILMLVVLYINRVIAIMLNVTSCTTDRFKQLLDDLEDNRLLAIDTRKKFSKNYQHRKAILDKIKTIKNK